MEAKIDLDAAAREIARRRAALRESGITLGPTTWRDQGRGWPPPIIEDRNVVVDPDSIGVAFRKGGKEGDIVLYRGGWADIEFWTGEVADDVVMEVAGDYDEPLSVEQFGELIDRLAERFG